MKCNLMRERNRKLAHVSLTEGNISKLFIRQDICTKFRTDYYPS